MNQRLVQNPANCFCTAVHSIEACASEIDEWMRLNKLKLNSNKSELLVISSKYRPRPSLGSISISEPVVNLSVSAINLGFIVDDSLPVSLEKHVNSISQSCYYHIRRIAKIRKYLSEDSTAALHAFITCRLDNGNTLLYGLPKYLIQRLQAVQNCAARLVSCKPRYARATPILRELHWLPVESRIIFKVLLLVYKSFNNLAPAYINSLLKNYKPSRNLKQVYQGLLTVPRSNQRTYGDRAFSVAPPKLWNALPLDIRNRQVGRYTLFKSKKHASSNNTQLVSMEGVFELVI